MTLTWVALFLAGIVSGTLNVVAGGGSFLTLPLLIFMGLPPTVANATNRIGILLQNVAAAGGFARRGLLDMDAVWRLSIPATIGSLGGAWLALVISDDAFRRILATLMVAVTLWTLLDRRSGAPTKVVRGPIRPFVYVLFFFIGAYAGFIQAGVGFFILAGTTLAGFDLVRGNAVKVTAVLIWTGAAFLLFLWAGQIAWVPGLVLGAGNFIGGHIGMRLTVLKGHAWVRAVVTVTILIFAVRLWFS